PGCGSASKTSTLHPFCASTIAAAKPLGPAPTTHARPLIAMSLPRQHRRRPFHHSDPSIRRAFEGGRVESNQLAPPPKSGRALLCHAGKPILPKHPPHLLGRLLRKRISRKQRQHIAVV